MLKSEHDEHLYQEHQEVHSCTVCAMVYPATRRRLARELTPSPVCSERCWTVLEARLSAAREVTV